MRRHPLWAVLAHQGRSLQWLARRTRYSESHIWAIKGGRAPATPEFRGRCAEALDLPEDVLFHAISSASAPEGNPDGSDDHAGFVVTAQAYSTQQEAPIGKTA